MRLFKPDEDALRVARAKDGSDQDLYYLWQKYYKRLFNLVKLNTSDDLFAEEVMGEILVRFIKKFKEFQSLSSFKTFLYAIAKNTIKEFLRKQKRNPIKFRLSMVNDNIPSPQDNEIADQTEKVNQVLKRLKPKYRIILVYRYYEQLTIGNIAKIMDKSEGAIYKLIERARNEFSKIYKRKEVGD